MSIAACTSMAAPSHLALRDLAGSFCRAVLGGKPPAEHAAAHLHDRVVELLRDQGGRLVVLGVDVVIHQPHTVVKGAGGPGQVCVQGPRRGGGNGGERVVLAAAGIFAPGRTQRGHWPLALRAPPAHVSLKLLSVFLCKLDTAMRAASCVA